MRKRFLLRTTENHGCKSAVWGLLILCIFLSACSYKALYLKNNKISSIKVVPVKNKINITDEKQRFSKIKVYPVGLENIITSSLKQKIIYRQDLKLVNEEADLIIEAFIIDFSRDVLWYKDEDEPAGYRLSCKVKVNVKDSQNNIIWSRDVGEDIVFHLEKCSYAEAQRKLGEKLADSIIDAILYRW